MIDKTYRPEEVEDRIYRAWEETGVFAAGAGVDTGAKPYSIVIPPPNVTGSLHMGHALNNTLQDILIRFERMRGRDVLWQPGTDHAGIATQMVVERQMMERQEPDRRTIGREAFVDKVWAWKEESGGTIQTQLKRLGASCDWSRERFTMDDGLSKAVLKVFVELYRAGLIYRDKRLVNWDTKFQTAISDLEVENIEVDGHMWHFKYPLAGGETYDYVEKDEDGTVILRETRDYISIATTRPETMLGDGAVAVHPSDERYGPIVGKLCEIPVGPKEHRRLIPIITDEYPDPEFGSGAVKITGAHDFNDFEVARRNAVPMYRLMDWQGQMRDDGESYADCAGAAKALREAGGTPDPNDVDALNLVPEAYRGLDRFEARKRVVADIDAEGLMIEVEDKKIMQPFGDRSHTVIEPMLTDQWYADAKTLAKPAIEAVERGETVFVPRNWEKTYFEWMRNIQPWCISRQLWWGHQIPAWYGPDGEVFVAFDEAEAADLAASHYGKPAVLTRDEDVLDTWFSSALWPFSTLGWPEDTPELKRYYQTDVLVTGLDIIFFWVARMMMMGLHVLQEPPFHTVYVHALVRDAKGDKMSKTKGNVIDPLDQIDRYGADALRFTLAAMAAQGRDIKLAEGRIEGYRNFATKLWNAARFCEMKECRITPGFDPASVTSPLGCWIAGEVETTAREVSDAIQAYRFNDAASSAYRFVWNVFCDWHIEFAKPVLDGADGDAKTEMRAVTAWALDQCLILLHPFMPFVTEELWGRLAEGAETQREKPLALTAWPVLSGLVDVKAKDEIDRLIDLISAIRSVRTEMNVPAGAKLDLVLIAPDADNSAWSTRHREPLERLARLEQVTSADAVPAGAVQVVSGTLTAALPLGDVIDLAKERARLETDIGKAEAEIAKIDNKLSNAKFLERAPESVVDEQRERRADQVDRRDRLSDALQRLTTAA
ncbi:MAG: valine--tRNA ligase [Pseudomonadota bacterium]